MHCNITGLSCLHDNYGQLSVLRADWSSRIGLYCDCQPSCEESEITVVADDRTSTAYAHSLVEISLDLLPSEKFRRNVVRGPLDLVGKLINKVFHDSSARHQDTKTPLTSRRIL